jgi:tetratricopeptide (TPR) repeat protein
MKRYIPKIAFGMLLFCAAGCSPPIMLPPVQEPPDSMAWQNCANDARARSGRSVIDDVTMDSAQLICEGVVLSNDPAHVDEAVEMLTEAAMRDKNDYRGYWLSARILTGAGRYEEALTHFARAKKRAPQMEVPTVKLAQLVADNDGDQDALLFLQKAENRGMCTFSCIGMLADLYQRTGQSDAAKKLFEDMLKERPEDSEAYIGLARISNQQERFDEEADFLKKAIGTRGFDALDEERQATIHYSRAFAHYNAGEYDRARKSINKALGMKSKAQWLLLAGWIELKLKDPAMGLIQFEKAIDADDKLAAAYAGAGDASKTLGNFSDADRHYRKATLLDPLNGFYKLKLAALLIEQKDYDNAKIQLKDALKQGEEKLPQDLLGEIRDALKNR